MAERSRHPGRWLVGGAIAVVVVGGGGVAALAATRGTSTGAEYRTAQVTRGPVAESLTVAGTVQHLNQTTAAFTASGTVTSVAVGVGQAVQAGQVLATIDATTLSAALLAAQATQAKDQAALANDQAGAASASSGAGSSGTTASAAPSVLAQADASLSTVQQLLSQLTPLCAPMLGAPSAGPGAGGHGASPAPTGAPTPTPMPAPTPSPTPTPAPAPAAAPTAAQVSACIAAVGRTTQALAQTESAVASAMRRVAQSADAGASGSARSGGALGTPNGASAAVRIAADQVALLQDQQSVAQAQANAGASTLTAPIAGTVAEVGLTVGHASGTTAGIVIVGTGAAAVTVAVPLAQMGAVHAGLTARVTPAGGLRAVAGTVTSVNLLPSSSATASPTYPATIVVADPTASLASGSTATVQIVLAATADALRVPVSALTGRTGSAAAVALLNGGVSVPTSVTVGAVGDGWVQILSGLAVGDRVILADASQPLPTNTTLAGIGGFGGGFRGGGGLRGGTGGAGTGGAGTGRGGGSGG